MRARDLKLGGALKYDYTPAPLFFEETGESQKNNKLFERRVERLWLQEAQAIGLALLILSAVITGAIVNFRYAYGDRISYIND